MTPLYYALYDFPRVVERLLRVLDEQLQEILRRLAELNVPYVEFLDNIDGALTSPALFSEHCLPCYQRYADALHGQGKKVGSHTDGDLSSLLALLAETGLDVCESFSPAPLTTCTVDAAWDAWESDGPTIWGGVPSPLLEERTSEREFESYVRRLLESARDRPIILDVVDMVLPNNSIERVRTLAEMVEAGVG